MKMYDNGDRCPCCGQILQSMSARELELFSQFMNALGMEPLEDSAVDLEPITGTNLRPPDAGIHPPVKPKI